MLYVILQTKYAMMMTRFQELFGQYYDPLADLDIMYELGLHEDYMHRVESDQEYDDIIAFVSVLYVCPVNFIIVNMFNCRRLLYVHVIHCNRAD